jgi:hypothetical protein
MVQVLLTIDTECSMGGAWENPKYKPVDPERAILGKIGSDYYGVPRIMDILEENGLRGTFFIEVFAAMNGFHTELAKAYSGIVNRGHDVQLHLHPIHYYYWMREKRHLDVETLPAEKDMIGTLPPDRQLEMLKKGISLFRELVGRSPIAFRAGNFGAAMNTLHALEKTGIKIDSSFSAAYTKRGCQLESGGAINRPWQYGAVWEIPITTVETGAWGARGWKPLNVNAVSLWEMMHALEQAERIGLTTATFIAHSFSLFKTADVQFRRLRPDWLVLRRFQGLCRFLKRQSGRFRVLRFSDLSLSSLECPEFWFPKMGAIMPCLRKGVQAMSRLYPF